MASGHMTEFTIDASLIGTIVGKKGMRLKQIKLDTGVSNISIDDDGTSSIVWYNHHTNVFAYVSVHGL